MNLEAIQKAMEELRMAKEEIKKLQKSRNDAENNVKKALSLVDSVKDKSESNSNYSDEAYWEDRYKMSAEPKKDVYEWYVSFSDVEAVFQEDVKQTQAKDNSLILVSGCGNSTLCEDISDKGFKNVHGMDYSPSVIKNMQERSKDLKLSHIRYFQADARYMPDIATGTYDVLFDKGTLDAIASAGASEGATVQKEEESIDALNYITEMWRILKTGGVFVLISTMPPEIIEPLALSPLLTPLPGVRGGASDWNQGCRVLPLTTQEGGKVYYYAIRKLAEITRVTTFRPGTTTTTTNTAGTKSSSKVGAAADNSGIMAGIAALLEEAKKAKESMEAAANKQRQAAAELRDVETKRAALESTLQSGLRDMKTGDGDRAGGEDDELGASSGKGQGSGSVEQEEESAADRKNDALVQHAIETAVRKVAPQVRLFVDLQGAAPTAEGTLPVYFLLHSTSEEEVARVWSEDDTVSLVCSAGSVAQGAEYDQVLYKAEDQPYEAFEYTDPPRALPSVKNLTAGDRDLLSRLGALDFISTGTKSSSKAKSGHFFIGQVTLKLPSFGGCFHVSYVRALTLPATAVTITDEGSDSKGKVVQRRVRLARSEPVLPRVPVYGAHPDARSGAVRALFADNSPSGTSAGVTIRRRGAGPLANAAQTVVTGFEPPLSMWVEDLSHIKTLNVMTALNVTGSKPAHRTVGRTMAWAQPSTTAPHTLQLFVEVDLLTSNKEDSTAGAEVRTVYGVLEVSDTLFERCSVDLSSAYGHVDAEGRFVCRLPYTPHPAKASTQRKASTSTEAVQATAAADFASLGAALEQGSSSKEPASLSVQCAFCKAEVVSEQSVFGLRPLPTGLLDNMMHDFICCEELSSSGLTSSDVETPQHTLLHGPLYASVHPAHLASTAVQLLCKTHSTPLDVFTGCGGALATAPIPLGGRVAASGAVVGGAVLNPEQRRQKVLQAFKTVINIDTCLIRCGRCASYLGDAHLQGENCDPGCEVVHTPSSSSSAAAAPVANAGHIGQQNFSTTDLRDVRFALHTVCISARNSRTAGVRTNPEQFVARSIVHINTTYNLSTFCLFASDADFENRNASTRETTGIIIKLVSPDYRTSLPTTASSTTTVETAALSLRLADCVKVSYSVGAVVDTIAGNEARLPLQYHELQQVIAALQDRSGRMGPSPFKGQALSYLRK